MSEKKRQGEKRRNEERVNIRRRKERERAEGKKRDWRCRDKGVKGRVKLFSIFPVVILLDVVVSVYAGNSKPLVRSRFSLMHVIVL